MDLPRHLDLVNRVIASHASRSIRGSKNKCCERIQGQTSGYFGHRIAVNNSFSIHVLQFECLHEVKTLSIRVYPSHSTIIQILLINLGRWARLKSRLLLQARLNSGRKPRTSSEDSLIQSKIERMKRSICIKCIEHSKNQRLKKARETSRDFQITQLLGIHNLTITIYDQIQNYRDFPNFGL